MMIKIMGKNLLYLKVFLWTVEFYVFLGIKTLGAAGNSITKHHMETYHKISKLSCKILPKF